MSGIRCSGRPNWLHDAVPISFYLWQCISFESRAVVNMNAAVSGPHFNIRFDVNLSNLMKSRSREICGVNTGFRTGTYAGRDRKYNDFITKPLITHMG